MEENILDYLCAQLDTNTSLFEKRKKKERINKTICYAV